MKLHVLGSSSSGNGYIIYNNMECLIIEAGINIKEVKKVLDFDLSIVSGCIVTHTHGDHAKYIEQYAKAGIEVFSHENVFQTVKQHHNYKVVEENKVFKVGDFKITGFSLKHDVPCFGFYINHEETGNFCFITDTSIVPYKFAEMNHILIESNYDKEIIDTNDTNYNLRDRIVQSHLSFDSTMKFISKQDLSNVHDIILLHASDSNSDISSLKEKLIKTHMKNVYVAQKGLEIEFNINPF